LHEAAGQALERLYADRLEEQYDLLAYHYPRSPNSDKAFEYLARANRKAMGADAPVEAKSCFERALALLDTLPDNEVNRRRRLALLADQIVVFQNLFSMQEYHELLIRYEPVATELGDPALLGPVIQQIGHCDWTFGRFDAAHRRFAAAAPLLEASGNYSVAAQTYQIWMWNYCNTGDFREVLGLIDRAERAWERGRNLRWYVYALSAAALAYGYLGRFREGIEIGHKAVAIAEELRDTTQTSFAAWALGFVHLCKGDLTQAIKYATLGVDNAPTPAERAWAQGSLASAWCRAGECERAIDALAPLYRSLRDVAFIPGERWALFLGEAYWRAGRYDDALKAIGEGLEIQVRHGMKYEAAVSRRLLAEVLASTNPSDTSARKAQPHPAEPCFVESIEALQEIGAEGDLALSCAGCGRLYAAQGRLPEAREYLERALLIVERLGIAGEPAKLRAELEALPAT
jgi:tetratricopeptide (TPR) repeat protein